jgi:hypothetical protein
MDSADLLTARGLPMAFRDYRAWPRAAQGPAELGQPGHPGHRQRVEAGSIR